MTDLELRIALIDHKTGMGYNARCEIEEADLERPYARDAAGFYRAHARRGDRQPRGGCREIEA
jgi:hypothetical protein